MQLCKYIKIFIYFSSAILTIYFVVSYFLHFQIRPRKSCKIYDWQKNESALAHKLLDNLTGIEIGAAVHNPFCLNSLNVDFSSHDNCFQNHSVDKFGMVAEVDVVAHGDSLPFENNSQDFVISSHVIEHFYDPAKAIKGMVIMI